MDGVKKGVPGLGGLQAEEKRSGEGKWEQRNRQVLELRRNGGAQQSGRE